MQTDPLKNSEDYFYIIDGAIKPGSYKLKEAERTYYIGSKNNFI